MSSFEKLEPAVFNERDIAPLQLDLGCTIYRRLMGLDMAGIELTFCQCQSMACCSVSIDGKP